jgi:hypothetical protein
MFRIVDAREEEKSGGVNYLERDHGTLSMYRDAFGMNSRAIYLELRYLSTNNAPIRDSISDCASDVSNSSERKSKGEEAAESRERRSINFYFNCVDERSLFILRKWEPSALIVKGLSDKSLQKEINRVCDVTSPQRTRTSPV